jgi:hypothetical protein
MCLGKMTKGIVAMKEVKTAGEEEEDEEWEEEE